MHDLFYNISKPCCCYDKTHNFHTFIHIIHPMVLLYLIIYEDTQTSRIHILEACYTLVADFKTRFRKYLRRIFFGIGTKVNWVFWLRLIKESKWCRRIPSILWSLRLSLVKSVRKLISIKYRGSVWVVGYEETSLVFGQDTKQQKVLFFMLSNIHIGKITTHGLKIFIKFVNRWKIKKVWLFQRY